MNKVILSTAYFPPLSYMRMVLRSSIALIELHENFTKQTYRNRCVIYSPGGKQSLTVPVERGSFHKTPLIDLRIDYSKPWQRLHLRALDTSYNSSAFYEFFMDDIRKVILKGHRFLYDLNNEVLELVCSICGIDTPVRFTTEFRNSYDSDNDMRYNITPKGGEGIQIASDIKYFQVFGVDNGFIPDLSILDLLFNMGPESYSLLKKEGQNNSPL